MSEEEGRVTGVVGGVETGEETWVVEKDRSQQKHRPESRGILDRRRNPLVGEIQSKWEEQRCNPTFFRKPLSVFCSDSQVMLQ